MALQTKFKLEDAEELQRQLARFVGTLQRELDRVENQWANLQATWRDDNYDKFVSDFFERFQSDTKQVLLDCENYEVFLNDKVKTVESLKQKLWKLAQTAFAAVEVFQAVTSVVASSSPVQAIIQNQSTPLTSECRSSPKLDDPLAKTEDPSAMPKEFEPLNDWQEIRKQKKEEEEEKQRNLPDHPETTGGK
jgi:phage host-nuclease inhibitor protein Gam